MLRRLALGAALTLAATGALAQTQISNTTGPSVLTSRESSNNWGAVVNVPSTGYSAPGSGLAQARGMVLLNPTTGLPYVAGGSGGGPVQYNNSGGTATTVSPTTPLPANPQPYRYQVAGTYAGTGLTTSTAGVVASAVGPLYSERSYILRCAGTLANGDSLQWQGLAADGATWVNIGSVITALPNSFGYVAPAIPAGSAANLRISKIGTGSDTLFCSAD